jgi:uncharacterized phage-like protein YoqJ
MSHDKNALYGDNDQQGTQKRFVEGMAQFFRKQNYQLPPVHMEQGRTYS